MLKVTEQAAKELKALLSQMGKPDAAVRILVREKGCSCSRYRMALEEGVRPGDRVLELGGLRVVADPRAAELLSGAVLNFVRENGTEGFVIHPPATAEEAGGCGCGHH